MWRSLSRCKVSALRLNARASSTNSGGPVSGSRASKRPAPSSRAKRWSRSTGPTIARTAPIAIATISASSRISPPAAIRIERVRRRVPSARSRICSTRLAAAKRSSSDRKAASPGSVGEAAYAVSSRLSSATAARSGGSR